MGYVGGECQGWGNGEASAVVQVGDKGGLHRDAGSEANRSRLGEKKEQRGEVGGGPAGGALTPADVGEAPPHVSWAPR